MILKKLDKADKANFEAELLNDKVKTFMMEEVRTRNPSLNLSDLKLDHCVEILMGSRSCRCNEIIPKLGYRRWDIHQSSRWPRNPSIIVFIIIILKLKALSLIPDP